MDGSIYLPERWIQEQLFCCLLERRLRPGYRLLEVVRVELNADEADPQRGACNRRTPEPQEWIGRDPHPRNAMELEAIGRQPPRERRRMRPFLVAALNRVVGQEPGVAAASQTRSGLLPARHIRGVLILHADGLAVDRGIAGPAEMEDELVAIVEEPLAVYGLVVADGNVAGKPGARSGQGFFDRDRFDPVDDVLKFQVRTDTGCRGCREGM
jgi:hypothetical protein